MNDGGAPKCRGARENFPLSPLSTGLLNWHYIVVNFVFHENSSLTFERARSQTDSETTHPTNKPKRKHNLLGGGKNQTKIKFCSLTRRCRAGTAVIRCWRGTNSSCPDDPGHGQWLPATTSLRPSRWKCPARCYKSNAPTGVITLQRNSTRLKEVDLSFCISDTGEVQRQTRYELNTVNRSWRFTKIEKVKGLYSS